MAIFLLLLIAIVMGTIGPLQSYIVNQLPEIDRTKFGSQKLFVSLALISILSTVIVHTTLNSLLGRVQLANQSNEVPEQIEQIPSEEDITEKQADLSTESSDTGSTSEENNDLIANDLSEEDAALDEDRQVETDSSPTTSTTVEQSPLPPSSAVEPTDSESLTKEETVEKAVRAIEAAPQQAKDITVELGQQAVDWTKATSTVIQNRYPETVEEFTNSQRPTNRKIRGVVKFVLIAIASVIAFYVSVLAIAFLVVIISSTWPTVSRILEWLITQLILVASWILKRSFYAYQGMEAIIGPAILRGFRRSKDLQRIFKKRRR